jgi:GNAT superfamily N-acetyltransferase
MIRPFGWRDFNLVRRMADRGICFDSEIAFTRGAHPLQAAMLSFLAPGVRPPTYVLRKDDAHEVTGFGQIRFRPSDSQARLIFVAPGYREDSEWEKLVEHLIAEAASRGAQNLIAEVNEHSSEFEALRKMGFAIYTRQTIWQHDTSPQASNSSPQALLRPQQSVDTINIQALYTNVTPRLIQQVEPPPAQFGHGFVFEESGEVTAFFDVSRGPLGIWVQPYLHPSSFNYSAELLGDLFARFGDRAVAPIYICVRSHQDWLRNSLTDLNFNAWGDQAVMVKRLAVRIAEPEFKPIPVIPGTQPTPHMIKSDAHFNKN